MRNRIIWAAFVIVAVGFVAYQFTNLPGAETLKGRFERVAFVRNENNLDIVEQIYAYTVEDPSGADYEGLANLLHHNNHNGVTNIYFFQKGTPVPKKLTFGFLHFDTTIYKPIAVYQRNRDEAPSIEIFSR